MEELVNNESGLIRNEKGQFLPGTAPGPGRPKGKTLKEYMSEKFRMMTDTEKEEWLKENKVGGEIAWKMAEGNPRQDTDVTSGGEPLTPLLVKFLENEPSNGDTN